MTEKQLRQKCVDIISAWEGAPKGSDTHHFIIDTYNSKPPLPRGVRMSYTMEWCAATVSAVGILAGLTDIMPPECSCGELIKLYQNLGRWVEEDGHIPAPGDLVIYSWKDDGVGECVTGHDHVGMVKKVEGGYITVIEGNKGTSTGSRVGTRKIPVDGRYIRGFCCPDFASKSDEGEEEMKVYHYVAEMPEWAQEAATKAINQGIVKMDSTGAVSVYEPNLQTLVWFDRVGLLEQV